MTIFSAVRRLLIRLQCWMLFESRKPKGPHAQTHESEPTYPWWKVMCLTGVDYFSTLGYQPGIAFLAASYLSPLATLVLVLVTLFGAYPVYRTVAQYSPGGQGSISILEALFPGWSGKFLVLILLGFAATDFIITITLSAADATAHALENPLTPQWAHHHVAFTLLLIGVLALIFLRGFQEAIGFAVAIVGCYLVLNLAVISVGLAEVFRHPSVLAHWHGNLMQSHGSFWQMFAIALLLFPKLALGLSGFETGVAVMPQIAPERIAREKSSGKKADQLEGRIHNTRKLLLTSAVIMSLLLQTSSLITTLLIPAEAFQRGGAANGRALAYIAHRYMGPTFGTVYDLSTILILAFAGASAMAGLLNLVPRYLPRFGMAPEWARGARPMVLVFASIAVGITLSFKAEVDAQAGAYATGVLVLMSSAAVSVTAKRWKTPWRLPFLLISLVFGYTTVVNIVERPEGIRIAVFFIALTIFVSLLSRALRSTELRISVVHWDESAKEILRQDTDQVIRIAAHSPLVQTEQEYDEKDTGLRERHHLSPEEQLIFLEIEPKDASQFDAAIRLTGTMVGKHLVLRASSPAVPNAIAAALLDIMKITRKIPHAYFEWSESSPFKALLRFLILGDGDVAPVTREVLRKKISKPEKRPVIHIS